MGILAVFIAKLLDLPVVMTAVLGAIALKSWSQIFPVAVLAVGAWEFFLSFLILNWHLNLVNFALGVLACSLWASAAFAIKRRFG